MGISKLKAVGFSALSLVVLLAWALPAAAHPTRAAGTTVNVISGKPSELPLHAAR